MAEVMTYTSLVDDIIVYAERSSDTSFIAQVPRFIMLAESDLAAKFRNLGVQQWVTSAFTASNPIVTKPARWRETISWNFGTGTNNQVRNFLLERSLEYCRTYWPDPTVTDAARPPKYCANYDWDHFFVVPTPISAYPFELGYYLLIQPLDAVNETNWFTRSAPQLILSATMLQAQLFLKWFDTRLQVWQSMYEGAIQSLSLEARNQTIDRATVVDKQ